MVGHSRLLSRVREELPLGSGSQRLCAEDPQPASERVGAGGGRGTLASLCILPLIAFQTSHWLNPTGGQRAKEPWDAFRPDQALGGQRRTGKSSEWAGGPPAHSLSDCSLLEGWLSLSPLYAHDTLHRSARSLACYIININICTCISFLLELFIFSLLKLVDVSPVLNMHLLESTLAKICKPKGQRYHWPPDQRRGPF